MELITLLLECATDQLPALLDSAAVSASLAHLVATSTLNSAQRQGLQQLITRLSSVPGTLSLPLLALYSYSYSTRNHQLVTSTIQQALESDSALAAAVQQQLPTLLQQSITHLTTSHPPPSYSQLSALLSPLLGLIRSLPPSYSMHFLSTLPAITNFYSQYLPSLLPSAHSIPTEPYLSLKLDLLESTHSILSHSFLLPLSLPSLTSDERATLLTSLQPLLASSRPSLGSAPPKALISAPLLGDLERFYGLSSAIEQAAGEVVEEKQKAEVKEVVQRVIGAGERVATGKGGLEVLRRMRELDGVVVGSSTSVSKGKQKAVVSDPVRLAPLIPFSLSPSLTPPPALPAHPARRTRSHPPHLANHRSLPRSLPLFPSALPFTPLLLSLRRRRSDCCVVGGDLAGGVGEAEGWWWCCRSGSGRGAVGEGSAEGATDTDEQEQRLRRASQRRSNPSRQRAVCLSFLPSFLPCPSSSPFSLTPLPFPPTLTTTNSSTDLLSDRTFMTSSIKASIIARAEHESSDEDGEGEGQTEAFVEDYDTAAGGSFGVRDAGEGEEGEDVVREKREVDSGAGTPVNSGRSTPLVRSFLFPSRSLSLSR